MAKTIFDSATKQELLSRVDELSENSKAQWGKMNPAQALRHMTMGFQLPLGEIKEPSKNWGTLKQKIFRLMLLNMPAPKGKAQTYDNFDMVARGINPPDFEAERTQLKSYIEKASTSTSFIPENPFAGKFSRDDWGRLMYVHTDHHLKQFGA